MRLIRKLIRNKKGSVAIEYALLSALIGLATIGSMQALGKTLQLTFERASIQFSNGAPLSSGSTTNNDSGGSDTSGSDTSGSGSTDTGSSDPAPTCKGKKKCP